MKTRSDSVAMMSRVAVRMTIVRVPLKLCAVETILAGDERQRDPGHDVRFAVDLHGVDDLQALVHLE